MPETPAGTLARLPADLLPAGLLPPLPAGAALDIIGQAAFPHGAASRRCCESGASRKAIILALARVPGPLCSLEARKRECC